MRPSEPINWYALLDTGEIVRLGCYHDFHTASDVADRLYGNAVWIVPWEIARQWCDTLKEIT